MKSSVVLETSQYSLETVHFCWRPICHTIPLGIHAKESGVTTVTSIHSYCSNNAKNVLAKLAKYLGTPPPACKTWQAALPVQSWVQLDTPGEHLNPLVLQTCTPGVTKKKPLEFKYRNQM